MADHKFTLEEILNEYSADGKRSGIRHTSEQPLSRGTLETEKLVNAATSERPLSRERAGYDTVAPPPENAEELVDIKSTISHIKASKGSTGSNNDTKYKRSNMHRKQMRHRCCGNAFPPSTSGGKMCPLSTPPVPDGIRLLTPKPATAAMTVQSS